MRDRGQKLDVVIELVVDDKALVGRIAKRAEETKAAGKAVRKDDDPAVFPERLREYYKKTAPLTGYYYAKGTAQGRRRHGKHRRRDERDRRGAQEGRKEREADG